MFHVQTMQIHLEYPGGLGVPSRDDSLRVCDNGAESVIEKSESPFYVVGTIVKAVQQHSIAKKYT